MRVAYLDCFSGISGDMLLGAFVQAEVSADLLRETLAALKIGATLDVRTVDRSGISAVKVDVLVKGHAAEHAHHHHHHEHRSLASIRMLIEQAALPEPVKATAIRTFELLGASEAKIHNVPVESIHFHEIGAVDTIADIVLVAAAVHASGIDSWQASPVNVGGGTVECAHGTFPVPAPATADLLRGAPTWSSGAVGELVTPTGAALLRALDCRFGPAPAMRVEKIGYGAGTRNPAGAANVLRLSLGTTDVASPEETVTVLETAVDDLNPQVIAYVTGLAFQLGALDVMCTPVFMKKNRPGTLITVLTDREHAPQLEELLFRETSTLGLRIREERRRCLERRIETVATPWGDVRIKIGLRDGREVQASPEFEDCRQIAEARKLPVKQVIEAALQVYRERSSS
jgi:pyridinium-3,5-bisthiocarboxylic acid mononucleotide nickel chelatase